MIKFYNYKYINNEEHIYNSETGQIFEVSENIKHVISQENKTVEQAIEFLKNHMNEAKLKNYLNQLDSVGLLKTNKTEKITKYNELTMQQEPIVTNMTLLVCQDCNLRCKYCYGDGGQYNQKGKMSFEVAQKSIDYLFKHSGNEKKLSIIIFGGEPLINFALIKQIVDYTKNKQKEFNKECFFSMTTNGILITPEIEKYLLENDIYVQVSIDGDETSTNCNRYNENGVGAYNSIIDNSEGILRNRPTSARGTVTDSNLNMLDSFEHLYDVGFMPIALAPAYNLISEENYELLKANILKMIDKFQEYIEQKNYIKCKAMKNVYNELVLIHESDIKRMYCAAGQRACAIDINGDIFPCHRFVGNKQYCVGNVIEDKIDLKSYIEQVEPENEKCKLCWARSLCAGGCTYENLMATGQINMASEAFCDIMKDKMESILNLYVNMTQEDRKILLENMRK